MNIVSYVGETGQVYNNPESDIEPAASIIQPIKNRGVKINWVQQTGEHPRSRAGFLTFVQTPNETVDIVRDQRTPYTLLKFYAQPCLLLTDAYAG